MRQQQHGFTLLEISIVMVVIGLIIGGVVFGQNLIRGSEIRNVISAEASIVTGTNSFKQKYGQLPGDFSKATEYWGAVGPGCTSAAGTGTQTCNGNGDGMIGYSGNGVGKEYERFRFWQHLSNAGMINAQFTGAPGPNTANDHIVGENCAATKVQGVGFMASNDGAWTSTMTWLYPGLYNNFLLLGRELRGAEPATPAFTANEAFVIDSKMDDGFPGRGIIRSRTSSAHPLCANGTHTQAATATYLTTDNQPACVLYFMNVF